MKRREFVTCGLASPLAATALASQQSPIAKPVSGKIRDAFPRMAQEIYLNAAALMPLSHFSQKGLENYLKFQQLGYQKGNGAYIDEMWSGIRGLFAKLIGAQPGEIGLVHCTKAGEQIAIDAVDAVRKGGNIVTNDLHFSGSLHNLTGLKQAGRDVRIVRAVDWKTPLEALKAAIDRNTSLVAVSLVSNINGHVEAISEIVKTAHQHGALVYADIIQAAGIVPLNVAQLGIDIAACSCYKWLYGIYGSGFLYVRQDLQGGRLPDRLFPGRISYHYPPWTDQPEDGKPPLAIHPRTNAARYEPGHVNYMGYCAAYEGLKFLLDYGVENALKHSVALNKRLVAALDPARYPCISPHSDRSPIVSFLVKDPKALRKKLQTAHIAVTVSGNRLRVSPAVYNTEGDIDTLIAVLNS